MERRAFTLLHDAEESWWYRGRALVVRSVLGRIPVAHGPALDFGAGFGGMEKVLSTKAVRVDGVETDAVARSVAKNRGYAQMYASLLEAPSDYALVGMFDVLEHMPDDAAFLQELKTHLAPDATLVLTVPAYAWLWSAHDVTHHHFRRYSRTSLIRVVRAAGFHISYASYWNMTLFFPAALVRLMGRSGESAFGLPRFIDRIFFTLISVEAFLMRLIPLPFGTSLILLAHKKEMSRPA